MKFRNNGHYRRIKYSPNHSVKPKLKHSNWILFFVGVIICVSTAPYLVVRKGYVVPSTLAEYLRAMMVLGPFAFCIVLLLLWMLQFKPYLEMKNGHYYVGTFEIKLKKQMLGFCYLKLFPGTWNWIKVNEKIFRSLNIGDAIELRRAPFGNIDGIRKVSGTQRVREGDA